MHLLYIIMLLYFTIQKITLSDIRDCLAGEAWYEKCKRCKCQEYGIYTCNFHLPSCYLAKCNSNVVIFGRNSRCHCSKNGFTVCVPLTYQPDLDGRACIRGSYYYDNCTFCQCDPKFNITKCSSINNCNLSLGGVCNDESPIMEKCHRCFCTVSKFRVCIPVEDCIYRREKPGKCRIVEDFYPSYIQDYCINIINQECYSDYACPGKQKCCQIVDCFLRCVDPL